MADEKYINKVIFGGKTLIDLTGDTITPEKVLSGYKAHDKSGASITGTCTFDADTSDATALDSEILSGRSAYVNGNKIEGAMTNNGGVTGSISTKDGEYTIPQGYHDGSGKVALDATEKAKLVAENIRKDVSLFGITGTMTGTEDVNAQTVTVAPSTSQDVVVTPDTDQGYNYLAQVTISKISYVETANEAGGNTVTIG